MEPDLFIGEWKEFEFRAVQEDDFPSVLQHLRESFYESEPINAVVGMTEDRIYDFDRRMLLFLNENMTYMAIDKKTEKIAGVLIMFENTKDKKFPVFEYKSPLTNIVRSFIISLEDSVDIFSIYGIDYYPEIYIVSVSEEFRGKGLASEMYRRGISMLKAMDYPVINSCFSNPISRKLGEKFGFKEIARKYFLDATDENGEKTMPTASPDQFVTSTVLELK